MMNLLFLALPLLCVVHGFANDSLGSFLGEVVEEPPEFWEDLIREASSGVGADDTWVRCRNTDYQETSSDILLWELAADDCDGEGLVGMEGFGGQTCDIPWDDY